MRTIIVDGVKYIAEEDIKQQAILGDYVIVRTESAGVFAGTLVKREGKEAELAYSRRIWRWAGAASLSQLAVHGTSKPEECLFPCEVPKEVLTEVVEVLWCTQKAKDSIASVKVWSE